MGKKSLDNAIKTGIDAAKIPSKKVAFKTADATGESIGNKMARKIVKPNPVLMRIKVMLKKEPSHQRKDMKHQKN